MESAKSLRNSKIKLKRDIVIPAGTEFECYDGCVSEYQNGNYGHGFGLTNDSYGELVYGFDEDDPGISEWFEYISD